ncbi:MAG: 50S ribosomal protein L19 [Myxococcales bacterium]|nr:50S ribosomal protein L19 [Myxococcales bacterium]
MSDACPTISAIEAKQLRKVPFPPFRVGDTVKVHVLIKEGEKERTQVFEGVCIKKHHAVSRATFTVRKVSYGVGVERIFPMHTPRIEKVEVVSRGRVRRANLNYLRGRAGKAARIREQD